MSTLHRPRAVAKLHSKRLAWGAALIGMAVSGCSDSPVRTSSRGDVDADAGADAGREEDGAVNDDSPMTDAKSQAVEDLFATWSEMRAAIRQSPDHLPARAEKLVQVGEVEEIFAFVRDEIVAVPGATAATSPLVSNGTRATLPELQRRLYFALACAQAWSMSRLLLAFMIALAGCAARQQPPVAAADEVEEPVAPERKQDAESMKADMQRRQREEDLTRSRDDFIGRHQRP